MTDKDRIKQAFERLDPMEGQKQKMWEKLSGKNVQRRRNSLRLGLAAVMIAVVVAFGGIGVDAATGGRAITAIREFCGWDENSREIVEQTANIQQQGVEVYAPEIFYLNEKILIFGNRRGLLIYDRQEKKITSTVDLQEIDCFYFNGEKKETHVLCMSDVLTVFNTDSEKPFGTYYCFDLRQESEQKLQAVESGEDQGRIQELYEEWKKQEKQHYISTFDYFNDADFISDAGKDESMYSARSYQWENEAGAAFVSCLLVNDSGQYEIYTKEKVTDVVQREVLNLEQETNENSEGSSAQKQEKLPVFQYSGDDPVMAAISEYMVKNNSDDGDTIIPAPVILKQVEEEDEILIFGNFWTYSYVKNGDILECNGGGEMPACIHLNKTDTGYEVTEVEKAGDGSQYAEDIRQFTKGYPGLYRKFMNISEEEQDTVRREWIRMYVEENELDVKYYKDFGWDPVAIAE